MCILLAAASTRIYAADESAPAEADMDFIEYLGEWQTDDGEWVDPDELDSEAYAQALQEQERPAAGGTPDE